MLVKKTPLNFKEAVLATENAYFDGVLNYKQINYEIENLTKLTSKVTETKIIDAGFYCTYVEQIYIFINHYIAGIKCPNTW